MSAEASTEIFKTSLTRPQTWQTYILFILVMINLFEHLEKDLCCSAFKMFQLTFPKIWYWVMSLYVPCARVLLVYKEFRKIRCQNTHHNTCIFLASYRTKIPGTKNTLDLPWFIPSVISNTAGLFVICLLTLCLHLPHSYQITSGLLSHQYFFFLASLVLSLSFFVMLWETSIWKSTLLQKHISSIMSPDKKP